MSSQISSFFSSVPSTARLEVPEELQRAQDFESTRNEAILEEEETTKPRLEMDRLLGYTASLACGEPYLAGVDFGTSTSHSHLASKTTES